MLLALSLGLSLGSGAALKGECFGAHRDNWRSRLCYNDIQPLFYDRGIDHHVFPYVHATLSGGVGGHGFNEYPVLTGLFMWATGWTAGSGSSFLVVTMILLSLVAALAARLCSRPPPAIRRLPPDHDRLPASVADLADADHVPDPRFGLPPPGDPRRARSRERFGADWDVYAAETPRFIPHLHLAAPVHPEAPRGG